MVTTYTMTGPDGKDYNIDGPDGATQQQVAAQMAAAHQNLTAPPAPKPGSAGDAVSDAIANTATFSLATPAVSALEAGLSHVLPGPVETYAQRLAANKAQQQATADAHPLGSIAGSVVGAVENPVGKLLAAAVPFRSALALRAGQPVRNVARLATTGATVGATTGAVGGGVQGIQDDGVTGAAVGAAKGAAQGAVEGAVAAPVVAGVAAGGRALRVALTSTAAQKAEALLAKTFGVSPTNLNSARAQFKLDTGGVLDPQTGLVTGGRDPSMGELTDLYNRGEIKAMVGKNPILGARVAQAADTSAAGLPERLQGQVRSALGPGDTLGSLIEERDANMGRAMAPIRDDQIPLAPDEVDFVRSEVLPNSGLKQAGRKLVHADLDQGVLSIGSADTLRKNLNILAAANPGQGFGELANGIRDIATQTSTPYRTALENYAADSRYINGHEHGLTGKTIGQTADPQLIADLGSREGQLGYQSGLATRYSNAAGKSTSSAITTAADLAQNAGTQANIANTFGLPSSQRLQAAAGAESRGLESLNVIAPTTPAPRQQMDVAQLGYAAISHSPGFKLMHTIKAMAPKGMSDQVAQVTANYLTDPRMAQAGINLMRAHGISQDQMRQVIQQVGQRGATAAAILGQKAQ